THWRRELRPGVEALSRRQVVPAEGRQLVADARRLQGFRQAARPAPGAERELARRARHGDRVLAGGDGQLHGAGTECRSVEGEAAPRDGAEGTGTEEHRSAKSQAGKRAASAREEAGQDQRDRKARREAGTSQGRGEATEA